MADAAGWISLLFDSMIAVREIILKSFGLEPRSEGGDNKV